MHSQYSLYFPLSLKSCVKFAVLASGQEALSRLVEAFVAGN